jgi:hypothetical protein
MSSGGSGMIEGKGKGSNYGDDDYQSGSDDNYGNYGKGKGKGGISSGGSGMMGSNRGTHYSYSDNFGTGEGYSEGDDQLYYHYGGSMEGGMMGGKGYSDGIAQSQYYHYAGSMKEGMMM